MTERTSHLQIGAPHGNGPFLSNFGLMYLSGDTATIKLWDGWPEREISFNHTDSAAVAAAFARCQELEAEVQAERIALAAMMAARPWWRKLLRMKP
jgi:hypothetical protein